MYEVRKLKPDPETLSRPHKAQALYLEPSALIKWTVDHLSQATPSYSATFLFYFP